VPSIISILVIGSGWMLVAMDQWQRTCASRSYTVSVRGILFYLVLLMLFAIVFAVWGAFDANVLPNLLPEAMKKQLVGADNPLLDLSLIPVSSELERVILLVVIAGLVFAATSTTNTFLNVCSHSLTSDILMTVRSHKNFASLTTAENRLFVGLGRAVIISIPAILMLIFAGVTIGRFEVDALSYFFIVYSVQFALLAPMVMSALPGNIRPSANAALSGILIGFVVSLVFGIGSWFVMQATSDPILGMVPGDWLTLTPVITILCSAVPLIWGVKRG
jgi:Na+/proline symporter